MIIMITKASIVPHHTKNLISEKSLGFGFGKFGLGRKVSVSVSEKFGLGKKSRFRFRKIWYRKKSLGIGFGQNFGIVIQCFAANLQNYAFLE